MLGTHPKIDLSVECEEKGTLSIHQLRCPHALFATLYHYDKKHKLFHAFFGSPQAWCALQSTLEFLLRAQKFNEPFLAARNTVWGMSDHEG